MQANEPCWCKSGKAYADCHQAFDRKLDTYRRKHKIVPRRDMIKNEKQIDGIREAGKINTAVLDLVASEIRPGMSTEQINTIVHEYTLSRGAIPATLHYQGYPKSVCTSINDEVCHGIPSPTRILQVGDIVNVDCTTIYKGYYADASRMFCIGPVGPKRQKLVDVAKECRDLGVEAVQPWGYLGDVGAAINGHARKHGYTVIRDIGGHGVGLQFHEDPYVCHIGKKGTGMLLVPGMVFTIEPMVNMGRAEFYEDADNGWTIYTDDGLPSAQWEVTLAVTQTGTEILTY